MVSSLKKSLNCQLTSTTAGNVKYHPKILFYLVKSDRTKKLLQKWCMLNHYTFVRACLSKRCYYTKLLTRYQNFPWTYIQSENFFGWFWQVSLLVTTFGPSSNTDSFLALKRLWTKRICFNLQTALLKLKEDPTNTCNRKWPFSSCRLQFLMLVLWRMLKHPGFQT